MTARLLLSKQMVPENPNGFKAFSGRVLKMCQSWIGDKDGWKLAHDH
jgi:hypothetical protein